VSHVIALVFFLAAPQADLESGFRAPPASSRPHTWWHWMNGNVTKEGITADLEAMKRIGLGGAQNFNVSEGIPPGPVLYMSPEWLELVKHAVKEANRLGLELCLHNCAGWSSSGGPWITPELAMQRVTTSELVVAGPVHFADALPPPESKLGFYRDVALLAFPTPKDAAARIADARPKAGFEERYGQLPAPTPADAPTDGIVRRSTIVDLTSKLGADGRLEWDVPDGSWTLLRIGHTPTGSRNAPAPESGRGLECDKLSRAAFDAHWAGMMEPVLRAIGPLAGRTLNNCLIDSYEVGAQNWTARMREEFTKRRGYDLRLLLPALTGRIVDDAETTERFLWDFRRTIADLFADEYYGRFAQRCRESGLLASIEPYDGPFDCLACGRDADVPMGEFWVGGGERASCKMAASLAHAYGRKYAAAESFTAFPDVGRWQNHPYSLKAIGDLLWCGGINRFVVHRYAHQPWLDVKPGMTMGQWGTHFERTTTWWEQAAAWTSYLARSQFLLQQGRFAADVCFLAGEAVPNDAPYHPELKPKGFDYDSVGRDVLLRRMSVAKDGRIVLPDGMSWRLLALDGTTRMTPAVAEKLRELVHAGATLLGPRPTSSPSLADLGAGDERVAAIAAEVWGDCDGEKVKERRFGAGRVMAGRTVEEALAATGVAPDCVFTFSNAASGSTAKPKMAWIHRVVADVDLWFVSNQRAYAQQVDASLRIAGRVPELWRPDVGTIETAPAWSERDGRTIVPIRFDPAGSLFVVFRRASAGVPHLAAWRRPGEEPAAAPPRIEIRSARYEAIDGAGGADVTAQVVALVDAGETSIPANNGAFGDPARNHYKRLHVEFAVGGVERRGEVDENGMLELLELAASSAPPSGRLVRSPQGKLELEAFVAGRFGFEPAGGVPREVAVDAIAPPVTIGGPWTLRFPPGLGAPPSVILDSLVSWTEHPDAGVRYFSGSADYEAAFDVAPELLGAGRGLELDLGDVQCVAEVEIGGVPLGVWWKPPFAADVTSLVRAGRNTIRVRVTNLWVNRLVGDEQEPDDCEWNGVTLKEWPRWLVEGSPRPSSKRVGFATWRHFTKSSPLLPSGLIGPVQLRPSRRVALE
jgi:hypothetical protein